MRAVGHGRQRAGGKRGCGRQAAGGRRHERRGVRAVGGRGQAQVRAAGSRQQAASAGAACRRPTAGCRVRAACDGRGRLAIRRRRAWCCESLGCSAAVGGADHRIEVTSCAPRRRRGTSGPAPMRSSTRPHGTQQAGEAIYHYAALGRRRKELGSFSRVDAADDRIEVSGRTAHSHSSSFRRSGQWRGRCSDSGRRTAITWWSSFRRVNHHSTPTTTDEVSQSEREPDTGVLRIRTEPTRTGHVTGLETEHKLCIVRRAVVRLARAVHRLHRSWDCPPFG